MTGEDEAKFEATALEYAFARLKLETPHAVFSGGSGSVQISGVDLNFSFESFIKERGMPLMDGIATQWALAEGNGRLPPNVVRWQQEIALEYKGCTSPLMRFLFAFAHRASEDNPVRLVITGSFFYTAVAAGLASKTEHAQTFLSAHEVREKLARMYREPNASSLEVANGIRLETILAMVFGEAQLSNVKLLFSRDWTIDGKPFRSTWAAGAFVERTITAKSPTDGERAALKFKVPPGGKPGDQMHETTPDGIKVCLVVPDGAEPGSVLTYTVPKGAKVGGREVDVVATLLAKSKRSIVWTPSLLQERTHTGMRLLLSASSAGGGSGCVTIISNEAGVIRARVDNPVDTNGEFELKTTATRARLAQQLHYPKGTPIMVVADGKLIDAVVVSWCSLELGNRHRLVHKQPAATKAEPSTEEEGARAQEFELDLNEANHCMQRFPSATAYEEARATHCKRVLKDGRVIEDAITGKKLLVESQVQNIKLAMGDSAEDKDDDTGELVRGVTAPKWMEMATISDLAKILTEPSPERQHGVISNQPVLIRAGPGTGKTWSMQQLVYHLAKRLVQPQPQQVFDLPLVPLLVYVQKLARLRPKGDSTVGSNMILGLCSLAALDPSCPCRMIEPF